MLLIVPDARLVVDSKDPVPNRQARHRSRIRVGPHDGTELLPNEHGIRGQNDLFNRSDPFRDLLRMSTRPGRRA